MATKPNGLLIQWGVVTNTQGSANWVTNNLVLDYSNTDYTIYLQGVFKESPLPAPIVNSSSTSKTKKSFQFCFGKNSNYCYYLTIGY